jgi:alpha-tubulin suppressor-like RCC1 family protein
MAWLSVAPGGLYTCGLSEATGDAYCWGGTSGIWAGPTPHPDSVMPNSAAPVLVSGNRRFIEMTVGEAPIVCGLDAERAAYCWGTNGQGEVGDGSYLAKLGPSAVVGDHRWRLLSAGGTHVCGLTLENRAYCWGNQFRGWLGNGDSIGTRPVPGPVQGNHVFSAIYKATCALTPEGAAYCWGPNDNGRLGDGEPPASFRHRTTPSRVVGGHRFTSLAAGYGHTCGIADDARGYCWGANHSGQLGNGTVAHTSTPTLISGNLRWRQLAAGGAHTCGITVDNARYCWGLNEAGQLGTGTITGISANPTPVPIGSLGAFVSVMAGGSNTCALTAAGAAFCWGRGDYGQLGNGIMANSAMPVPVRSPR